MMLPITLLPREIDALCPDITQPMARVKHLRQQGFTRARVVHGAVVLERAHFEAVCRGEFASPGKARQNGPELNLSGVMG